MGELSNFEYWWKRFAEGCSRMAKKGQCRTKFEKYSLEIQKIIYKDTADRLKHFEGWQELDSKGKRKYMQGPQPYLVAAPWETPLDTKTPQKAHRDTSGEVVRPIQNLLGLRQFRDRLHNDGLPTMVITEQINALKRKINEEAIG